MAENVKRVNAVKMQTAGAMEGPGSWGFEGPKAVELGVPIADRDSGS